MLTPIELQNLCSLFATPVEAHALASLPKSGCRVRLETVRIENLEWVTHAENMRHAYKAGAIKLNMGKNHHEAKKIKCIATGEIFDTVKEAAEKAGVNNNTFRNSLNTNCNREYIKLAS